LDQKQGMPKFINEKGEESPEVFLQDLNTSHLVYGGSIDPLLTGGFFNGFQYKNIRLTALVTFSTGNVVRLRPAFRSSYTELDATPDEFLNRWLMYGDDAEPSILDRRENSDIIGSYPYNNYNYSTRRVAKGDFIRLKQVMLSYNLPQNLLKTSTLKSASLSLVANNLWLIYSDKDLNGQDPEFFGSGGVAMPIPRQFTLSLKLGI